MIKGTSCFDIDTMCHVSLFILSFTSRCILILRDKHNSL